MSITQLVSMNDDNGKKKNIENINTFGASYQDLIDRESDLKIELNLVPNTADFATTTNIGGTYNNGVLTSDGYTSVIDGHTISASDLNKTVIMKNQDYEPFQNGVYKFTTITNSTTYQLTRVNDFNSSAEFLSNQNKKFKVLNGEVNKDCELYLRVKSGFILNTDPVEFSNSQDLNSKVGILQTSIEMSQIIRLNESNSPSPEGIYNFNYFYFYQGKVYFQFNDGSNPVVVATSPYV